jgi:hypothetical protein
VTLPERVTDEITEKTSITTEPEIEVRKPATLAQALTEPEQVVVKPRTRVQKEVISRKHRAA